RRRAGTRGDCGPALKNLAAGVYFACLVRSSVQSGARASQTASRPASAPGDVFTLTGGRRRRPMAQKLFVGSLSFSTTSEGLREFFAQAGNVTSATVITDQFSGRSRGFGFVEMSTPEEAQAAVQRLNGKDLDGRQIKVEMATREGSGGGG